MAFELPKLSYAFNALEPHIDALTMEIHYGRHHQTYITNLNNALAGTDLANLSLEELMQHAGKNTPVRNNGGGHWNHSLFWATMSPNGGGEPAGELGQAMAAAFGSFAAFKEEFGKAGLGRFGSGWAWLVLTEGGLKISSTPNQDNPLMDVAEVKGAPLMGLDVWEHAYYLKYQNKRADYIGAWWNVVDWNAVAANFAAASK